MSRSYTVQDIEMPSVTTVLGILDKSDALLPWAVRCATSFIRANKGEREKYPTLDALLLGAESEWRTARDEAGDIGSEIHGLISSYILKGADAVGTYRPEVEKGFLAFLEWEKQHGVKWLKSEMTVSHESLCFAGTLDAICEFEGKSYVVDFKSSNGFYDTFGMQIAAYHGAVLSMGETVEGCGILRLDKKTGEPEWKDYSKRQDRDYKAFCRLLDYWYSAAKRKLKNNPRVTEGEI